MKQNKNQIHPRPNCSPPLGAARPALARTAPSLETTAPGISPANRRSSGIRRHQLAELDHRYKLMRRGTHRDPVPSNKAQIPAAPRIHCSRCAPGNPSTNGLARRSGAILHAAGILQRLVRLGGKKESRNPPSLRLATSPSGAPGEPQSAREKVRKNRRTPRCHSKQTAARAQMHLQHAPHLTSARMAPPRLHCALSPPFAVRPPSLAPTRSPRIPAPAHATPAWHAPRAQELPLAIPAPRAVGLSSQVTAPASPPPAYPHTAQHAQHCAKPACISAAAWQARCSFCPHAVHTPLQFASSNFAVAFRPPSAPSGPHAFASLSGARSPPFAAQPPGRPCPRALLCAAGLPPQVSALTPLPTTAQRCTCHRTTPHSTLRTSTAPQPNCTRHSTICSASSTRTTAVVPPRH